MASITPIHAQAITQKPPATKPSRIAAIAFDTQLIAISAGWRLYLYLVDILPFQAAYARAHARSSTTLPPPSRDQPSQDLAQQQFQFTATDMALFHHLLTSIELTGWSPRAQQELCRPGFAHHFVLRLLLAFAGFHIVQTPDLANSPYMGLHTGLLYRGRPPFGYRGARDQHAGAANQPQ
ncbi:uncharacterized protein BO80DRAFT_450750 [Aspergillus ibericus CBS 121593]|uniref:Uncharacterized protein n=1 Tax=Aspergillus ibericus CBS 121593 TaxID=1448316 RepID=A0A395GHP6_9EURO|nr:hypothetical protein BO80DRAFT_450750 [Aspergillus ibericus CBS 121593]RAK94834.1 hypothetical protein BO80DRAFT_450750 [Aspergillus ibericus CBS 121593]